MLDPGFQFGDSPMNWLAHLALSTQAVEFQLGNLLADQLKGNSWKGAPVAFEEGMRIHAQIDVFTDSHPQVQVSKRRLAKKGYLKGVVVDVVYDHLLATHWHRYFKHDLDVFIARFEQQSKQNLPWLPERSSRFVERLHRYGVLASYRHFGGVEGALVGLDSRLSPRLARRELASDYIGPVRDNLADLDSDFQLFFPELADFVRDQLGPQELLWLK